MGVRHLYEGGDYSRAAFNRGNTVFNIIESVDSISRDGPDTPIYVIPVVLELIAHYKQMRKMRVAAQAHNFVFYFNLVTCPLLVHVQSMDTVMALLKFFSKSSSSLPSAKETGIGEVATKEANAAVSRVLTEKQPQQSSSVPADRPRVK